MYLNCKENLEPQNQAHLHQILVDSAQILHGAVTPYFKPQKSFSQLFKKLVFRYEHSEVTQIKGNNQLTITKSRVQRDPVTDLDTMAAPIIDRLKNNMKI